MGATIKQSLDPTALVHCPRVPNARRVWLDLFLGRPLNSQYAANHLAFCEASEIITPLHSVGAAWALKRWELEVLMSACSQVQRPRFLRFTQTRREYDQVSTT
jgi:hypothetical protein